MARPLHIVNGFKNAFTGQHFRGYPCYVPVTDALGQPTTELERDYPLRLLTHRIIAMTKSRTISNYWLLALAPDNGILMNPRDAATGGLHNGDRVKVVRDPREAVVGAHLVSTDVWTSMGQGDETAKRLALFSPYQVNKALLDLAAEDVIFMHCLPAHRGEEISVDLLDDPRSVAWDQAENRLHAQKALLELLVEHASHA